jgi:hypothetical protein
LASSLFEVKRLALLLLFRQVQQFELEPDSLQQSFDKKALHLKAGRTQ